MKYNVYSIFDKKAKKFNNPFFEENDNLAKRSVSSVAGEPSSILHNFPFDFALYVIGEFDSANGFISGAGRVPTIVAEIADFVETNVVKETV